MHHLLSLYTTTKSISVALPGELVGNFDCLLQHDADVVIADATRHVDHYVTNDVITKPRVHNVLHR